MQNIFGILFWVAVAVFIGFGIHGMYVDPTPWWWIFWILLIGTIVGAILLRNNVDWIGTALAYYCAQMCENNNWWNGTCFALAIIFTISFWLAGLGEPAVPKAFGEVSQPTRERIHTEQGQRQLDGWLYGTDYTGQKDYKPVVTPLKKEKSKYSSWVHFWAMIFWWIVALISYPVTRRDEVAHAFREGIKRARAKRDSGLETGGTGGSGGGSHEGVGHHLMDFAKLAIPFEVMIELVEILFTKFFSKIKPLAQKVLSEIKGV